MDEVAWDELSEQQPQQQTQFHSILLFENGKNWWNELIAALLPKRTVQWMKWIAVLAEDGQRQSTLSSSSLCGRAGQQRERKREELNWRMRAALPCGWFVGYGPLLRQGLRQQRKQAKAREQPKRQINQTIHESKEEIKWILFLWLMRWIGWVMAASGPLRAENCSIASLFIQQFHNSAWPLREKKTSPQFTASSSSCGAQPTREEELVNLRKFALIKESKWVDVELMNSEIVE